MDRVNLILEGLAFGAANVEGGATDAVKGAHGELKGLVAGHFGGDTEAEMALERYEKEPDVGRKRLKDALDSTGTTGDFAVAAAAQRLLKLVDPEGDATGKYAVNNQFPHGQNIGDEKVAIGDKDQWPQEESVGDENQALGGVEGTAGPSRRAP
jgi:hypothetical protein